MMEEYRKLLGTNQGKLIYDTNSCSAIKYDDKNFIIHPIFQVVTEFSCLT